MEGSGCVTVIRSSPCRFSTCSALSFTVSSLYCMLENIHYLSPAVLKESMRMGRDGRLKPNMREWKKGRHRGDCISPNGQKLRQPSDIVPFYNTVCRPSTSTVSSTSTAAPGKRKRLFSNTATTILDAAPHCCFTLSISYRGG